MSPPNSQMKSGHVIGFIVDISAIASAGFLFYIHWLLGTACAIILLQFLPGTIFRELDEESKPTAPHKPIASPYQHLVGTEAKVVAALKPHGFIQVGDNRIDARSYLGLIPMNTMVTIIEAEPTAVTVKPIERT